MAVNTLSGGGTRQAYVSSSTAIPQEFKLSVLADVASNTNNLFFFISSTSTNYYLWMNVSGAGTLPLIPNRTAVVVTYSAGASAATIATAIATAITNIGGTGVFTASATGGDIYVKNTTGSVTLSHPLLSLALVALGWTYTPIEVGSMNNSGAGNGMVYLFTTPTTADYTYEIVISTILTSGLTTPLASTVAAPIQAGPNTPIYIPLVWTGAFSTILQFEWTYNGYKLS